jgi:hypothetical protein
MRLIKVSDSGLCVYAIVSTLDAMLDIVHGYCFQSLRHMELGLTMYR